MNTKKAEPAPETPVELPPGRKLLLKPEVIERARLSDTTIWRLERAGRFPKRQQIGFRRVAWRAADIEAWIAGTWAA